MVSFVPIPRVVAVSSCRVLYKASRGKKTRTGFLGVVIRDTSSLGWSIVNGGI